MAVWAAWLTCLLFSLELARCLSVLFTFSFASFSQQQRALYFGTLSFTENLRKKLSRYSDEKSKFEIPEFSGKIQEINKLSKN